MDESPIVIGVDVEAIYRRGWIAGYAACMQRADWPADQAREIAADMWRRHQVRDARPWQDVEPGELLKEAGDG